MEQAPPQTGVWVTLGGCGGGGGTPMATGNKYGPPSSDPDLMNANVCMPS